MRNPSLADESWNELAAMEHDLGLYSVAPCETEEQLLAQLRARFFQHPFVRAVCEFITEDGRRFGAVKEQVQRRCTNDPVPYRRELTPYVQALYSWLAELAPDHISVTRPRHSQIMTLRGLSADAGERPWHAA